MGSQRGRMAKRKGKPIERARSVMTFAEEVPFNELYKVHSFCGDGARMGKSGEENGHQGCILQEQGVYLKCARQLRSQKKDLLGMAKLQGSIHLLKRNI